MSCAEVSNVLWANMKLNPLGCLIDGSRQTPHSTVHARAGGTVRFGPKYGWAPRFGVHFDARHLPKRQPGFSRWTDGHQATRVPGTSFFASFRAALAAYIQPSIPIQSTKL
jgi:hypothetical protein